MPIYPVLPAQSHGSAAGLRDRRGRIDVRTEPHLLTEITIEAQPFLEATLR
jgi:hypothetical protein